MPDKGYQDSVASRIENSSAVVLDDVDHQLINLLHKDGRMPFRALAKAIGVTEATARARVRRLEDGDVMRVVAVTDFEAVGYTIMLAVGIQVEGRPAEEVAAELASHGEVFSACQVVGSVDIEVLVVARDQTMLNELLTERMAKIPGVRRIFPALAMDVLKNQPNWVPFDASVDRRTTTAVGAMDE